MNIEPIFIKKFCYTKTADVNFLPPLIRRKLSNLDKYALTAMDKVYSEDVEEIIFASRLGESDRLNKIISQYKEMNEVSPTQFSASVHNYPVGFFTLYKKINIPYFALSAGEKTFQNGFLEAVISNYNDVMFVYAENDFAVSCIISKASGTLKIINIPESVEDFVKIMENA